jgi:hypothetical protein
VPAAAAASAVATSSFDFIKQWPHDVLLAFVLCHERAEEKRRECNRKYSASANGRKRQRRYYFSSRDIYHPQVNPAGLHEKRWKRPPVSAAAPVPDVQPLGSAAPAPVTAAASAPVPDMQQLVSAAPTPVTAAAEPAAKLALSA